MALLIPSKYRKFVREMTNAARPGSPVHSEIMGSVEALLQARIRYQFKHGVGPDDMKHKPKKNGKPALVSPRLGNAARARAAGNFVYVEAKTTHVGNILDTHQDGHTFPPRDGKVFQYRDRKGKIISYRKFVRRVANKGATRVDNVFKDGSYDYRYETTTKRGVKKTIGSRSASVAKFGARTLPPRPIRPVRGITRPWQKAIAEGLEEGLSDRIEKFTK